MVTELVREQSRHLDSEHVTMRYLAALVVTALLIAELAACSSAPSNPQAVTMTQCKALAAWEADSGSGTVAFDPTVKGIISASAGTRFGTDLAAWVSDTERGPAFALGPQTSAAADQVIEDCDAVGVQNVI
jgi:hypothetical protein